MGKRLPRPAVLQRFGRLRVLIPEGRRTKANGRPDNGYAALCICDCGKLHAVAYWILHSGQSTSCGCFRDQNRTNLRASHGGSNTPEHRSWAHAKARCRNPNHRDYQNYGGRGVTFSPLFDDFAVFLAEVGPKPSPRHTIERIKNERGYEPGNIRWATRTEQNRNKRNNIRLLLNGEPMVLRQAAMAMGLRYLTVYKRRQKGLPPERWFEPHRVTVTLCDQL